LTPEREDKNKKQNAERQRAYRERKSNELTVEEREEQRKKRDEQQRDYRQRKSNELTVEEREEQRKKRAEQQRDYRQRRQYSTNIHVSANAELDEEEDSTKVRTLEDIYRRAPRVTLAEINNVENVEEVQMEEVPIANLVIDEEIQIDDNVFVSFEEMNIRHRKFRDRIDRLAEVQMCISSI